MKSDPNPYAVPSNWDGTSLLSVPVTEGSPKNWIDVSLLVLIAALCVFGSLFSLKQIEAIIPTGLAVSVFGILLTSREIYMRRKRKAWNSGLWFGIIGPLFSLIVFGTIFFNHWSPQDARRNGVPYACLIFSAFMCVLFLIALKDLRTRMQVATEPAETSPEV